MCCFFSLIIKTSVCKIILCRSWFYIISTFTASVGTMHCVETISQGLPGLSGGKHGYFCKCV